MKKQEKIYKAIIANHNNGLTAPQKDTIYNIVNAPKNRMALPSEIAHQICVHLEISLQENYANLTEIISNEL